MTESITIDTGEVELLINQDPNRVIRFNPTDLNFAERYYKLIGGFHEKQKEFEDREIEIKKITGKDANGMPLNFATLAALDHEVFAYTRAQIDEVFGPGTSQTAFGDTVNSEVLEQFLTGVSPYFKKARVQKIEQYTTPASAKKNKRKR